MLERVQKALTDNVQPEDTPQFSYQLLEVHSGVITLTVVNIIDEDDNPYVVIDRDNVQEIVEHCKKYKLADDSDFN